MLSEVNVVLRLCSAMLGREAMISAIIHLGNRDWASLVDDFVSLNFLPANCDRSKIIPVCSAATVSNVTA